jgi:quercetin dioxygenase-like cupin family protein/uncharacterized RmlC-like cupin family protein
MRKVLSALAAGLCLNSLAAQAPAAPPVTPNQFVYYSGADLKAMGNTLKSGGQITWNRIHRGDHDFQGLNFRAKSSAGPEMHNNWTDLYYIVDGEVNHLTGGTLQGGTERTPGSGEFGGGRIVGGTTYRLGTGDIASSAAGVPHWWEVEPGKTVAYMTIKILKQPDLQARILAPNPPALMPTKFVQYKAADLKAMVATLNGGGQVKFDRVHRGDHDFQGINFRKASSVGPEMHNNWADLYYVLDGEVTIRYGDRLEGGKEAADGEARGGEIIGNVKRQKLVAGDVASSPAGIPHFWELQPGKTVTYMTVKLGKQHAAMSSTAR